MPMKNRTILHSLALAALCFCHAASLEAATINFSFASTSVVITPVGAQPTQANPTAFDTNIATVTTSLFPTGTISVLNDFTNYGFWPGPIPFAPVSGGGNFTA